MDLLLGKITSQAMNYAIRSGIAVTATYAISQCTRLLKDTPKDDHHRHELLDLQLRLGSKIRIISPAIDMIDLISARGNTTLENAVILTKGLRCDIQRLGSRITSAAARRQGKNNHEEILAVIIALKAVLVKIEDAIPLINLAISTSGVSLSTRLSGTISPSRLLQASTFLVAGDTNYTAQVQKGQKIRQQVGPTWTLTLYMLFAGHARAAEDIGTRETTWKEVIHKARVKIVRLPMEQLYDLPGEKKQQEKFRKADVMDGDGPSNEFAYQLVIVEDLDDGRAHSCDDDDEFQPGSFDGVLNAGIRDIVPIHEISKIFYADTGKILNIGSDDDDVNNPVLLIKRDVHAEPPRWVLPASHSSPDMEDYAGLVDGFAQDQSKVDAQIWRESTPELHRPITESSRWRLPDSLDPEWMAFEVHTEEAEIESEDEGHPTEGSRLSSNHYQDSPTQRLTNSMNNLHLQNSPLEPSSSLPLGLATATAVDRLQRALPQIKTSLSLLEMQLKLTSLQNFLQQSHLSISDEMLNFFLEDSSTTGATGGDKESRRKKRFNVVNRLGFDPYDESPVKRRGEEYIAHARSQADDVLSESRMASPASVRPEWLSKQLDENVACQTCGSPVNAASSSPTSHVSPVAIAAPAQLSPELVVDRGSAALLPKPVSQSAMLATPPTSSYAPSRFPRAQSEPQSMSSPLSREVHCDGDEGCGVSFPQSVV